MNKELTGAQKPAILLRAMGEETAAAVMKALDPKDIRKLGSFMKETANITKQEEEQDAAHRIANIRHPSLGNVGSRFDGSAGWFLRSETELNADHLDLILPFRRVPHGLLDDVFNALHLFFRPRHVLLRLICAGLGPLGSFVETIDEDSDR